MTRKNPDRTAIRERLRPGEKHFRMLVDHAPDGIFIADAQGRYLEVNAAWCEMLGYSHDEILGMMVSDVLVPDEAPRVASEVARLRDGDAVKSVWRFRRKDDSSFYGEVNGRQLADSRLVGYVRDISQRKRTELALENSRALLQSFVEHTPAAVAMLDKELRYVAVSRRWMHDYELGARDLIGQCHYDVFPEIRSMPQWQSVYERCLSGAIERRDEDPFVRANGRTEWLRWEVRPWRGEHGAIGGIIMFTEVITERKLAESRLRESETLLRGLVETSPIPMLVVTADADGRVLLMNQRFTETFGYSLEEVPDVTEWWLRAYPDPAYRTRVRASWNDAVAEAERTGSHAIAPVAAQVTCRDGSIRDLEVLMGRFGNRALVVFSDFTERRHTDELLQRSEERYRLIVENQTEFIVKWRPDGTRTFVNDSYCRTFGVREQDCVGTSFLPLIAPEYREGVQRQMAMMTPANPEFTEEHVSLIRDGRRWQQWTNRGIFDADGRLVEVLSTGRDVSERREAEEKLRESRMHLLASQHIARVGSWEMDLLSLDDLDHNPRRWSDECYRIFGFAPGEIEVTGSVYFERVHADDRDEVRDATRRAVRDHAPYSIDYRIVLSSGDERVLHEQAEPVLDPVTATPVKFIGTTQDVTDRVRLEEQLRQSQKMQAIGQLAGGVAHDFNNLLTVINGYAETLIDGLAVDDRLRDDLTPIRDAGQRAALLTRQLLLFSRKAVLEPRLLDCNAVVQQTSQMLRRLISEEIEIAMVPSPSLGRVKADPSQIEQVLMNLSLNACDAMPHGGRLTIETRDVVHDAEFCREHPESTPGRYAQIVVSDTGCGMTPYVKAHLFEPFFTTKGPGRGTGLGLATVYGILQASGGFVTVTSDVDMGTTFNVFLPALDSTDSSAVTEVVDHTRLRGNETVLVVEDDPGVRAITTRTLAKYGYHVLEATDGPTALLMSTDRETIDLLVSDVVMPEMSGRRLADALLSSRPQCRVLFMSGYNEEMLADRTASGPTEAFIQKPFTPVTLARKVREILDRRV